MSLGNSNSTLLSELNRLANGGTYPPVNTLDEAAAARAWAGRTDIPLTTTDTVGVLNEIAGLPRDSWLDYSGVCNYIAGTTGLPAAAALRQVEGESQTDTPSEPLLIIATPENESVVLNWAPPANSGDAPVDNYRVTVQGHPELQAMETVTTGLTFSGLTNGVTYFFLIEAHNIFGWGPTALSPGAIPFFESYAAVQNGSQISFVSWREAQNQPDNGFPGRYYYSDGTQLFQGQTAIIQGSTTPYQASWGNSNQIVQPDGWKTPSVMPYAELWDNVRFNYSTSVNITPNYTCPVGGFYNPGTGLCQETVVYSWTVPFNNNSWWYISNYPGGYNGIDLYGLNPRNQAGWPQVDTVITFTISGITGPNAALNGKTITATATATAVESFDSFGAGFDSTYTALGLPGYISYPTGPNVTFPGFTLNWS